MKINTDKKPFVPEGWKVEEHRKCGTVDLSKLALHLEPEQKEGHLSGDVLRERLKDKSVLNANVLDYLLKHPKLIPEEWKGKYVFFWGTIYRDSGGSLSVRYLYWYGGRWYWFYYWLDHVWHGRNPALVSAGEFKTLGNLDLEERVKELEDFRTAVEKVLKI